MMTLLVGVLLGFGQQFAVIGDWKGTSICKANKPVCKDEIVVYHIAPLPDQPGVSVMANKIVNGVEEAMGILNCVVDVKAHTVTCPMPPQFRPGLWKFSWRGNTMQGTLTEPSGKLIRVIRVARVKR